MAIKRTGIYLKEDEAIVVKQLLATMELDASNKTIKKLLKKLDDVKTNHDAG